MSHFTTIYCTKTDSLVFLICYVRMPSISLTDCCPDTSILAPLSAYQEYLVTFKLIMPQVVQRVGPLKATKGDYMLSKG